MLTDHAAFIDNHKPVLHVTDDEFVDLRQIGQIYSALFGDFFSATGIFGERKAQARDHEVAACKQAALEKICGRGFNVQDLPGLLKQNCQGRHGRMKKRETPACNQSCCGQTDQQQ